MRSSYARLRSYAWFPDIPTPWEAGYVPDYLPIYVSEASISILLVYRDFGSLFERCNYASWLLFFRYCQRSSTLCRRGVLGSFHDCTTSPLISMTTPEQFILLAIGLFTILVRIVFRWRTVGPANWQLDDYLMPLTGVSQLLSTPPACRLVPTPHTTETDKSFAMISSYSLQKLQPHTSLAQISMALPTAT
jgi:hypothetical protein